MDNVITQMKERIKYILILLLVTLNATAQEREVENRPYTDLRPFHFGVVVGTHLQDIEFKNMGPQTITNEDGTTSVKTVTCDQDRWDPGFTVGVLGEFRLGTYLAFRLAPTMYFGTRHLTFYNHTDLDTNGNQKEERQDLKSVYIAATMDLIYSAQRFNNYRPYIIAGLNPMLNISSKESDYIKLKRYDCYFEIGVGCDFYLPFFKLRPELKFCYSLLNTLDKNHAKDIKDKNMLMYTNSVVDARTKMVALSFYFE